MAAEEWRVVAYNQSKSHSSGDPTFGRHDFPRPLAAVVVVVVVVLY